MNTLSRVARASALSLLLASPALAQGSLAHGTPRDVIRTVEMVSRVLNETRIIDVTLPASYGQGTRRYPVLIVLDGESLHLPAAALARFYASVGELPEMLVVGVRNTDRQRDLTPAPRPGWRPPPGNSGGAATFSRFLSTELIAAVDSTFRTLPFHVLAGHSLGGLFVLDAIASDGSAFQGFLALDPSTWWNGGVELDAATAALTSPRRRHARVMLANTPATGLDTTSMGGDRPMVRHFSTPGDMHATMPVQGLMRGLRTLFSDFRLPEWKPWQRPLAMVAAADSLSQRLGFDVPVPEPLLARAVQMSVASRYFDEAAALIQRMKRSGATSQAVDRAEASLAQARSAPAPSNYVPLEYPARRPRARDAARAGLLGRWKGVVDVPEPGTDMQQEFDLVASGDTVAMILRQVMPSGATVEQVTSIVSLSEDGELVWAETLRGIAGIIAYVARIGADGALAGQTQVRGFALPPEWDRGPTSFRFARVDGGR